MNIQRTFADYLSAATVTNKVTGRKPDIVIFHHCDNDGFVAAACAYKAITEIKDDIFSSITFVPVQYGGFTDDEILEAIKGPTTDVWVLDFSFKEKLSDAIHAKAGFFLTIDHHASAEREIGNKPYTIFDMESSGALMAFQYFIQNGDDSIEVPLVVKLVDNRDLWKKELGTEDQLHEALMLRRSKMHQEKITDGFLNLVSEMIDDESVVHKEIAHGAILMERLNSSISAICKPHNLSETIIGGYKAVMVNAPLDQSSVCEYLYNKDEHKDKIVCAYSIKGPTMIISMRKHKDLDIDLGSLAQANYGGGGHAAAAGFSVNLKRGVDILSNKEKWALCWPAAIVSEAMDRTSMTDISARLCEIKPVMRSRTVCETDTNLLQILPYIVIRAPDGTYFTYNRPSGGTEKRLHGNDSIGLGGHVDTPPAKGVSIGRHLGLEAQRELDEEVGLVIPDLPEKIEKMFMEGYYSLINVTDTPVDSVHLGIVFVIDIDDKKQLTRIEESEVGNPRWSTITELTELKSPETWTRIVIEDITMYPY